MESRYADNKVVYTRRRGKLVRGRELRPNKAWTFSFTQHLVKEGERVDSLAHRFYRDAEMWYLIADANPEVFDWFNLYPGMVIRIPYVLA